MPPTRARLAASCVVLVVAVSACAGEQNASATPSVVASRAASPGTAAGGSASTAPSAAASLSIAASPSANPGGTSYTVQPGDTLSAIARAWGTTLAQLQAWNADRYPSLAGDPNALQAGWVLLVSGDPNATPRPSSAPTARPTPAPTPVASGCRAGNRVAAGGPQTFYVVPSAGNGVALTFDMGGRLDPGVEILNFLIANRVCATLFPTGAMAQTEHGRRIMAIVRAHPELFEIGNHTMHHCDLVRGGGGSPSTTPCAGVTPTADFVRRELNDAAAILRSLTGQDPRPYWRPPYGSLNAAVVEAAASAGYTKTFMWDIDTIDWKPVSQGGPTAGQIATKVITTAEGGSNVLMHLGGYETLAALRIMVPGLRDRGFVLTSLSDLLN
ncbi:MAG TPA: polysaccharide deacetylase family protein [Candidatus Limnocylindria bacterium]|nr:polysaccharide deacetylase family protein [Candidatus Limnocylindria bacterium]